MLGLSCCPGLCPTVAVTRACVTTASAVVVARRPAPGEEGARGGSARPLRKPDVRAKGSGEGQCPGPAQGPGRPAGLARVSPEEAPWLRTSVWDVPGSGVVGGGRLTIPRRQAGLPKCSAWPGKAAGGGFGTLCTSVRPVVRLGWGGDGPKVRKGLWSCCPSLVPPAALRTCRGECQAFAHSLANARC